MTGQARREQLMDVGRVLFAEKGYEGASIEEVAHRAGVSKPVVYEHFGGKDRLYAVVVDREMRELLERAALALLDYIQDSTDGFRILVRDSPVASKGGTFSSLLNDIARRVEHILGREFAARGYDTALAGLFSQALVGMVALTGQWWLDVRSPGKDEVAAHLVNLAWNGLSHLEHEPLLRTAVLHQE